jgi:RHS repeat-associated protein
LPDGRLVEYLVDGQNRRVAKRIDGVTTKQWLWSSQLRIAGELDASGTLTKRFIYGEKVNVPELMVDVVSGAVYRIVTDQLGSPVLVVNVADTSDVLLRAEYDAFGNRTVLSGDGDVVPFGFAGGLYDEDTGLVRFGARDYDPVVGRWVTKDPIRWEGGQGNFYVYSLADPANLWDLTGLTVYVCETLAEDPWLRFLGIDHHWLKTDSVEAGFGGIFDRTSIVDHSGDFYTADERREILCEERPDVDEDCVDRVLRALMGRTMGRWSLWNNCMTFVDDVVSTCSTSSSGIPGPNDIRGLLR